MERVLPELRFDNVALADVIDFLRDVSNQPIFVNWRALEVAGVAKTAPVNARLRGVKFSKALATILEDAGAGQVKLTFTIDQGVITISTAEDLEANVVTNVYDIRSGKLVWTGLTETEMGSQMEAQIQEFIQLLISTMTQDKFL
jgi:hypothetical protein